MKTGRFIDKKNSDTVTESIARGEMGTRERSGWRKKMAKIWTQNVQVRVQMNFQMRRFFLHTWIQNQPHLEIVNNKESCLRSRFTGIKC